MDTKDDDMQTGMHILLYLATVTQYFVTHYYKKILPFRMQASSEPLTFNMGHSPITYANYINPGVRQRHVFA